MNIRNVCKLYKQNGRKSVLIFSHSYSCIYGNICLIIRLYVLIFVCLILLFFFLFSQRYEIKQEKSRIWLLLNCSLLYLFCPQHKKWYLLIFLLIINKNTFTVTVWPACSRRSSPHICVRFMPAIDVLFMFINPYY